MMLLNRETSEKKREEARLRGLEEGKKGKEGGFCLNNRRIWQEKKMSQQQL